MLALCLPGVGEGLGVGASLAGGGLLYVVVRTTRSIGVATSSAGAFALGLSMYSLRWLPASLREVSACASWLSFLALAALCVVAVGCFVGAAIAFVVLRHLCLPPWLAFAAFVLLAQLFCSIVAPFSFALFVLDVEGVARLGRWGGAPLLALLWSLLVASGVESMAALLSLRGAKLGSASLFWDFVFPACLLLVLVGVMKGPGPRGSEISSLRVHALQVIKSSAERSKQSQVGWPADLTILGESVLSLDETALDHELQRLSRETGISGGGALDVGAAVSRVVAGESRVFNEALLYQPRVKSFSSYSKRRLVPFFEYLPMQVRSAVDPRLVPRLTHFSPGPHPDEESGAIELSLPEGRGRLRISFFVCYEIALSGFVASRVAREKPDLIINLSSEAWPGGTRAAEYQVAQARLRAIETGLPLLRVSATGQSAWIDPTGRTRALLQAADDEQFWEVRYGPLR